MAGIDILQFKGIAPNVGADVDFAQVAEGVDLSGGVLRGFPTDSLVSTGHAGEFVKFNGAWESGDTDYLPTNIEGADALIFKRDGSWMVKINGTEAPLWINVPTAPLVVSQPIPAPKLGTASISTDSANIGAGTVDYYAKYVKIVSGAVAGESDFSAVYQTTQGQSFRTTFTRPVTPSSYGITHIELYRRRSGETSAGLVVRQDISVPQIEDNLADADLGELAIVDHSDAREYSLQYLISWVRDVGGWVHESAPSAITQMTANVLGATVYRSASVPDRVTGWRIYRISTKYDPTVSFQLVADLDISVDEYVDRKTNFELGDTLPSQYVSESGAPVVAGVPDEAFTGMFGPVNGYYIGWYDDQLFLSEPGNPAWWPGQYVFRAAGAVVGIENTGNRVMVVTDAGVQIGYGANPDTFSLSPVTMGEGGAGRHAMDGGFYLAYDGIYQVTDSSVDLVTSGFPASYFKSIISASDTAGYTMTIRAAENRVFFLHSAGALCYDNVSQNWITFDGDWDFGYVTAGKLYVRKGSGIYEAFSGTDLNVYTYTTGRILAGTVLHKFFEAVRVDGTGTIHVSIEANGEEVAADELDLDSEYNDDRYLYLPSGEEARAIAITFMGTGVVRSVHLDIYDAESEAR